MGVPTKSEPTTRAGAIFFLIAGALLAHHLFIRLLSEQFHYDTDTLRQPILLFVSAQFLAGVIYLYLLRVIPQLVDSQAMVWSMIAFGLLFRLLFFDTEAILEIDFYRYLWDGGVLANGINPYLLAPAEVAVSGSEQLREIAASSEPILSRVHYSELRTIYPPLSQLAFALSYWVNAWSLDAWRMLILLAECSSLFILLKLLKAYGRSLLWASLYWWSPLVTKELINSAHMDALLVPFILGAVLLLHQHRLHRAIALIAVASGVKLWPMILAPFVFVRLLAQKSQLSIHAILFGCLLIVFVAPLFFYGLGENSGFSAYASYWEQNSSAYKLLELLTSNDVARVVIAIIVSTLSIALAFQSRADKIQSSFAVTCVIATLFLLSPTQFPWYFVWFAPLLCLHASRALLLLTPLLSLYYLRFYFDARDQPEVFDNIIVWVQFVPVWTLLIIDYLRPQHTIKEIQHV